MPDFLVSDFREPSTQGTGPVRVGMMRGGLVFEQIGNDIQNASTDPGMGIGQSLDSLVVRFMGQIWTQTENGNARAIRVYDEGGIDDWIADPTVQTAKGCVGANITSYTYGAISSLIEVLTEQRAYLVGTYNNISASFGDTTFWRYNPDTNVLDVVLGVSINAWTGGSVSVHGIAHDGLVYWADNGTSSNVFSFDPVTGTSIIYLGSTFGYTSPGTAGSQRRGQFFTLHDRLFLATLHSNGVNGENAYASRVVEFAFGIWTESPGLDTNMGDGTGLGGRFAIFKLAGANKVLLIGPGSDTDPDAGIVANVLTTVGDAADGVLQNTPGTITTTLAVIPLTLRPPGGSYGGGGTQSAARCYGTTVTDDSTGQIRHFLYLIPDGSAGMTTVPTMYEVFDDVTPIVIINQTPQMDSRFSFPGSFYGGGVQSGGIDGSTRYVSVQARGWAKGNLGVQVKVSAHGDAMVLTYRDIATVPFTPEETITGGISGATAILIGDGANEGLFLRDVSGGPFVADELVTGGISGATATLNTVLLHNGVAGISIAVGELVTGGTSTAFATVTHVGLGGPGEQLVKVGAITNGPFQNGEIITGGTNGGTATLSVAPLGFHGGAADKTIRARFFDSVTGSKGVPSGFATMVEFTGIGGIVSKGTGPGGSDELINVIADGAPGDTPISFEWDFLTDGIDPNSVAQMLFEIDRA